MTGAGHPRYRPEIDGLRALAVASVIVYHAYPSLLPGGLAGVDVFFVISGYLITSKLMLDLGRGTFSLTEFWVRRLRRIAPALLFCLLVFSLLAMWALTPDRLSEFGKALIASVLPVSNFYLRYQPGGYFAPDSRLDPLVHMWSLAVEEQFYLLYPVALLVILRFKPRWLHFVFSLGLVMSLAVAAVLMAFKPAVAFYYLPPRAWELMLGGAVALNERRSGGTRPAAAFSQPLIWLSITGLLAGFLLLGGSRTFPWPGALLPCLSTSALLVLLRPADVVARVLAARPLVFIGMISYSLYLWHQPAFAFARSVSLNAVSVTGYLWIICGLLPVAWASWKFVEQPLRWPSRISNKRAIVGMVVVAAILIAGGFAAWAADGWRSRFPAPTLAMIDEFGATRQRTERCQSDENASSKCGSLEHWPPALAILGDSHAFALSEGLTPLANSGGVGVITLWKAGCPPVHSRTFPQKRECIRFIEMASQKIRASSSIRKVIVMARWAGYMESAYFDNGEGGVETTDGRARNRFDRARVDQLRLGLLAMVAQLQTAGKQVVIVGPVPEVGWNVPEYLWKSERFGTFVSPTTSYSRFLTRQSRPLAVLCDVAARRKVSVVYPDTVFCSSATGRCATSDGLSPFYWDDDHLSPKGAQMIVQRYRGILLL